MRRVADIDRCIGLHSQRLRHLADSGPGLWTVDIWGRNEQQIKTQTYASDPNWGALRS